VGEDLFIFKMPRMTGNVNRPNDVDTVILTKKRPERPVNLRSEQAVNQARRTGAEVETKMKYGAGANKHGGAIMNTLKLDNETENLKHKTVPHDVGKAIMQGRQAKGMTQKDLATSINEKPQIVAEMESGRAVMNQQVLGKLERSLGVKLRGKEIGTPLGPRGKKK